jgi:hypothetical protein
MTSHFAISIEKPAIPRAPNINAISANIKNVTASPIKSAIFQSPFSGYILQKVPFALLPLSASKVDIRSNYTL